MYEVHAPLVDPPKSITVSDTLFEFKSKENERKMLNRLKKN